MTHEDTEPTVQATVDGANTTDLVDTGSSGLVIPETDLGSNFLTQLEGLIELGIPSGIGESGYSGGVDYIYLTYDNASVDYATTTPGTDLDTTAPVEVEIYSWDPGDLSSLFTNDAFQNFLNDNEVTGILGIGDNTSGGAGESPLEADGFTGVTVDEPQDLLIVSDTNAGTPDAAGPLNATGSTISGLTEDVSTRPTILGPLLVAVRSPMTSTPAVSTERFRPPSTTAQCPKATGSRCTTATRSCTPTRSKPTASATARRRLTRREPRSTAVSIPFEENPIYIDYSTDTMTIDS